MAQFTNTAEGPRGINLADGTTVWVEPGQSVELGADQIAKNGVYPDAFDGADVPSGPPSLSGKNKAQLLEIAAAEGVEVAEDATNAQIVDAIEAKRAA
jgi:hypothetical protein